MTKTGDDNKYFKFERNRHINLYVKHNIAIPILLFTNFIISIIHNNEFGRNTIFHYHIMRKCNTIGYLS